MRAKITRRGSKPLTQARKQAFDTGECRIFKCSQCGYGVNDIYQENERDYPCGEFNFCPHCGAEIRRE